MSEKPITVQKLESRIQKLDEVGQHAFDGTDYSFGFNAWKSGTLTLLKSLLPDQAHLIDQIEEITLKRVDVTKTDASAYNLEACKDEAREILKVFIETIDHESNFDQENDFWQYLHPNVVELARTRFENELYADSVSACLREINTIMKEYVKNEINQELDGATLMTKALSANNPLIELGDISTESGRNIQTGYMKIFEGAMIGIRNPKAHENTYPNRNKAIHLLFIVSFMFVKLEEAGIIKGNNEAV